VKIFPLPKRASVMRKSISSRPLLALGHAGPGRALPSTGKRLPIRYAFIMTFGNAEPARPDGDDALAPGLQWTVVAVALDII